MLDKSCWMKFTASSPSRPRRSSSSWPRLYEAKGLSPDLAHKVAAADDVIAVALSLGLTSLALARWGQVPVARTIVRNVGVGVTAMFVSLAIGSLFDL